RCETQQRLAGGGRSRGRLGADIAAGARAIVEDEWLTQALRQPLRHQASDDVRRTARRKAEYDMHRPRRISLRFCGLRQSRKRGGTRCQMEKTSAGKFHRSPKIPG